MMRRPRSRRGGLREQRLHLRAVLRHWNWKVSAALNRADFYDLFGPTRMSRRGHSLALQYADFATWQRRRVSGTRLEGLTSFWREELGGAAPVDLPTDRPRPPVASYAGDIVPYVLPDAVADQVQELARSTGATPFMVFQALVAGFLTRPLERDSTSFRQPPLQVRAASSEC